MQVKSIAECSKRAFCNTFDLHFKLSFVFKAFVLSVLRQVSLYFPIHISCTEDEYELPTAILLAAIKTTKTTEIGQQSNTNLTIFDMLL